MAKDLSNYFNKWTEVSIRTEYGKDGLPNRTAVEWCTTQFGVEGLKWMSRPKTYPKNEIPSGEEYITTIYSFKNEEDALLFIMKFS